MTRPFARSVILTEDEWQMVAAAILDAYDFCLDGSGAKAVTLTAAYNAITGEEITQFIEDEM